MKRKAVTEEPAPSFNQHPQYEAWKTICPNCRSHSTTHHNNAAEEFNVILRCVDCGFTFSLEQAFKGEHQRQMTDKAKQAFKAETTPATRKLPGPGDKEFTPGTWKARKVLPDLKERGHFHNHDQACVYGPEGDCLAFCNGIVSPNLANATLMAASPALYKALKKITERLDRWEKFGIQAGGKGADYDIADVKLYASYALARAEGK